MLFLFLKYDRKRKFVKCTQDDIFVLFLYLGEQVCYDLGKENVFNNHLFTFLSVYNITVYWTCTICLVMNEQKVAVCNLMSYLYN